jgi:hypothetical protein
LAHEASGGFPIAETLNKNIEDKAIVIHRAPQPMFLAGEGENDLD